MATPQKPLNFNPKRLTLKQLKRFIRLTEMGQDTPELIDELEHLLAAGSDWTYEEIEDVSAGELEMLVGQIGGAIGEANADAVPPPTTTA